MAAFPMLPLDLLDDGLITCGDYPDWATAFHLIKRQPRDVSILNDLLETIPERGLDQPLWIEVGRRTRGVSLRDGHHRAVALDILKIRKFPYCWRWYSPQWNGQRVPPPGAREPLPLDVLIKLDELSRV